MLGNDIVDLRDPDSQPESFRPRFDERVFGAEERIAIERDRVPLARRWAHWAAKEAAYKLAKQVDPGVVFAPGRCIVRFEADSHTFGRCRERLGVAEFLEGSNSAPRRAPTAVRIRSLETEDFVHSIAVPIDRDFEAVESKTEMLELESQDASDAVRSLAADEIARSLGVARSRISIGRRPVLDPRDRSAFRSNSRSDLRVRRSLRGEKSRIPCVELDGQRTTLALSLSHHGRFIAYAMAPQWEAFSLPTSLSNEPRLSPFGNAIL